MDLTRSQRHAVAARGNVLVKASAGTGKTRTLVERCLAQALDDVDPVPLDRVLVVTFTEAAATEVRHRLRLALEQAAAARPDAPWPNEQLATLDTAAVGTLHSFCLKLVRQHFDRLGLDPRLTVLEGAQAEWLATASLETVLEPHYAGDTPADTAVQNLILAYGRGRDEPIRDAVRRLHEYTRTLPDPEGWLDRQLDACRQPHPRHWQDWLRAGLEAWRDSGRELLLGQPPENQTARAFFEVVAGLTADWTRDQAAGALAQIAGLDRAWPRGHKVDWRPPLARWLEDAAFWHSLAPTPEGKDPLDEDWARVRPHLSALLELTREFGAAYAQAKRDQAALDFHDLEQFALQLLWDPARHQPTALAQQWRHRLRLVFVDEYQDINAVQDRILELLSRDGPEANRFLVGDVKQSIYRFRLADPRIFRRYERDWRQRGPATHVIALAENFRSHPAILEFVNRVFGAVMRPEVGGVEYDDEARLIPGGSGKATGSPAAEQGSGPRIELHLRLKTRDGAEADSEPETVGAGAADPVAVLDEEHEARLVAERLRQLHTDRWQVRDFTGKGSRAVEWRDIAVLLRSPRNKAESYAKEFARCGIPLVAARRGFYDGTEVTDLLGVLQLLDNPLQDVPLLAVLRSPIVGLSLNDLAAVRLAARPGSFWAALRRFHEVETTGPAWTAVDGFLKRFDRWRKLARRVALSRCLEAVLDETGYLEWLVTQPRGEMRCANVHRLLAMTRQFDRLQRQGLFRFLKLVEAQQAADIETEPVAFGSEDAVRLMSIHQAKGLEFPVVVVADLGKPFSFEDLKQDIILDDVYGLGPVVQSPQAGPRYPSLPCWLARQRQRREALGEELRLLYVAMTRAADKLILSGTARRKTAETNWAAARTDRLSAAEILAARNSLDWLGPILGALAERGDWLTSSPGQTRSFAWRIYAPDDLPPAPDPRASQGREGPPAPVRRGGEQARAGAPGGSAPETEPAEKTLAALRARLRWRYPHAAATIEPAKTSVSALRRRVTDETEAEARRLFASAGRLAAKVSAPRAERPAARLSAVEIGIAHHVFLEHVSFECAGDTAALEREAARLEQAGVLQPAERTSLDLAALAAFWESPLGRKFRARPAEVWRELPFTARFGPDELTALNLCPERAGLAEEFVVVQGVVDWAVILPDAVWVVDFKTDHLEAADLPAKVQLYTPQLRLYAAALTRICRRPVTELWLHFLPLQRSVSLI